jgi:hypothetical protein
VGGKEKAGNSLPQPWLRIACEVFPRILMGDADSANYRLNRATRPLFAAMHNRDFSIPATAKHPLSRKTVGILYTFLASAAAGGDTVMYVFVL